MAVIDHLGITTDQGHPCTACTPPDCLGDDAELIEWHQPAGIALEEVYFGRNVDSAMKVGQASGVAMLAAALTGVPGTKPAVLAQP